VALFVFSKVSSGITKLEASKKNKINFT